MRSTYNGVQAVSIIKIQIYYIKTNIKNKIHTSSMFVHFCLFEIQNIFSRLILI